jgi:hypothetical protein
MNTEQSTASQTSTVEATKTQTSMRLRLARQILIFHIVLVGLVFVYYMLSGFDREEFTALMGMLMPLTAIYAGTVFKFLGGSLTKPEPLLDNQALPASASTVRVLIYGHFILMSLLISTKALAPNLLNFEQMTVAITALETVLGVYMGNLLISLFKLNE